jgi:hypothetical protein
VRMSGACEGIMAVGSENTMLVGLRGPKRNMLVGWGCEGAAEAGSPSGTHPLRGGCWGRGTAAFFAASLNFNRDNPSVAESQPRERATG